MNTCQKKLLRFANKYPKLHSFADDAKTVEAVCGLHNLKLVRVHNTGQFKITGQGVEYYNLYLKGKHL